MTIEVRYFKTLRGNEPVAEYVWGLGIQERAAIRALINRLGEGGYLLAPEARKMAGTTNLWELRYRRHRIFYCYYGRAIVLVHAYAKQSQRTPQRELDTAVGRMKLLEGKLL